MKEDATTELAYYVPASAGACLRQATPGNAYPSLPGNA